MFFGFAASQMRLNQIIQPQLPIIGEYMVGEGGYFGGIVTYGENSYYLIVSEKSTEALRPFKTTDTSDSITADMNGYAISQLLSYDGLHPASTYCASYTKDGHNDFFLPTQNEHGLVALNLAPTTTSSDKFKIGNSQAFWHFNSQPDAYLWNYSSASQWISDATRTVTYRYDATSAVAYKTVSYNVRPMRMKLMTGSSTGAHSYWRLLITELIQPSNQVVGLRRVQMRSTIGGPDVCVGGSPIASGDQPPYTAASAFVDNTMNWASQQGAAGDWWIGYHFPTPTTIQQIVVDACPSYIATSMRSFLVQYSNDGTEWTTCFNSHRIPSWADLERRVYAI